MNGKIDVQQSFTQNRWFRLGSSVALAFGLAVSLLLLPVLLSQTVEQQPNLAHQVEQVLDAPVQPNWKSSVLLEVNELLGTDQAQARKVKFYDTLGITITKVVITQGSADFTKDITTVFQLNDPKKIELGPTSVISGGPGQVEAVDFVLLVETNELYTQVSVIDQVPDGVSCVNAVDTNQPTGVSWGVSANDCRNYGIAKYTLQTGEIEPGKIYPLRFTVRPFTYNNSIVTNDVVTVTAGGKTQLHQSIGQTISVKAPMHVVTKTALSSAVSSGDIVQYTINLGNAGGTDMFVNARHPITIVDVLPLGLISSTNKPTVTLAPNVVNKGDSGTDSTGYTLTLVITGTPDGKNPLLTATNDYLSVYKTPVATVSFKLDGSSLNSGQSFTNTVMVHGGINVANKAITSAEVFYFVKPSQLTIAKTAHPTEVVAGGDLTYTVHFTAGVANLANVVFTDTISQVTTYADFVDVKFEETEGTYSFLDAAKNFLQIRTTKPLTAKTGARAIVRFKAHKFITPGLIVTNILKIEDVVRVASDTVFVGNASIISVPVTISSFNKIVFTKTVFARNPDKNGVVEELPPSFEKGYVKPGETITYRLVLANEGTGYASVAITDVIGAGFQFVNGSINFPGSGPGSLNQSGNFSGPLTYLNRPVVLTSGTELSQRAFQFSAVATTTNLSTEPYTNDLTLEYIQFEKPATLSPSVNSPNNNPVRIIDTVITVTKEAVKSSPGTHVALGDVITYTYKITNGSSITLTGIQVVDSFRKTQRTLTVTDTNTFTPGFLFVVTDVYTVKAASIADDIVITGTTPNVRAYLSNTVVVTGKTIVGNIPVTGTDKFGYLITSVQEITIEKTVLMSDTNSRDRGSATVGSQITYAYTITNLSFNPVEVATIKDDKISGNVFASALFILPGFGVTTATRTTDILGEADIENAIKNSVPTTSPKLTNTFSVSSTRYFFNTNTPVVGNKPAVSEDVSVSYTAGFSYLKKVVIPSNRVTATVNDALEFQIVITNTGGATLTLANPFTDFLPSLGPGLADVYTASSGIVIPPNDTKIFTSEFKAGANHLGSFPLTSAVAISSQTTTPGISPLSVTVKGLLTNTVYTPQLKVADTISTSFPSLFKVLSDTGSIITPSGVISDVAIGLVNILAPYNVPGITVPLTYTAGVTIAKYVVLSDGTQAVATDKISVTDVFAYRYYVTNTGQVPLVITLTDLVTTSRSSDNLISGTHVLYNPDGPVSNGSLGNAPAAANPSGTGTYTKPLEAKTGMYVDVTSVLSKAAFSQASSGRYATISNTAVLSAYVVNQADPNLVTNPTFAYTLTATSNSVSITSKLDTLLAIKKVAFVNGVKWNRVLSAPARLGDVVTYQVYISNTGDLVITNINFVDVTPLGQEFTLKDSAVMTLTPIVSSPNVLATGLFTLPKQSSVTFLIKEPGKLNDTDLRRAIGGGVGAGQALGNDPSTPQLDYRNFVTATGFVSDTGTSISANTTGFTETVYLTFTNSVTMNKVASLDQAFVGQAIIYTYTIRNNGDVAIALVEVLDGSQVEAQRTIAITGNIVDAMFNKPILPPSGTVTITYSFTPDENEFSYIQNNFNGYLTNTAKAIATPTVYLHSDVAATRIITPAMPTATATVMLTSETGINIKKTADWPGKAMSQPVTIGNMVTYTYRITNTGRISFEARFNTITNSSSINLIDDKLGILTKDVPVAQALVLAPQEVVTVIKTIEISYAELAYYPLLTNTVQVTGYTSAASPNAAANNKRNPTEVPLTYTADFEVSKVSSVASGSIVLLGDPITYTITISNNSPLTTNFKIEDVYVSNPNKPAAGSGNIPVTLALKPGGITRVTYIDRALPAYLDNPEAGKLEPMTNVVTIVANDGGILVNKTKSATVGVVVSYTLDVDVSKVATKDSVTLVKKDTPVSVTYNYVVTNSGKTPVTLLNFFDTFGGGRANSAITGPKVISAGESVPYSLTITVDELTDIPVISNVAQAVVIPGISLTATQGITVASNNGTPVTVTVNFTPSLKVVKRVGTSNDGAKFGQLSIPGQKDQPLFYTFQIFNLGPVTMKDLFIQDTYLGKIPKTEAKIEPGGQIIIPGRLIIKNRDLLHAFNNSNRITNTAVAIGQRAGIPYTSTASNEVTVTLVTTASVRLTKTVNVTSASRGSAVVYQFEIANTSGVTLTNVLLTDKLLGLTDLPVTPSVLPVGAAPAIYTHVYTIPNDAQSPVINTAKVTAASQVGTVSHTDTATVTIASTESFTFNVVANPSEVSQGNPIQFMIEDLTPTTTTIVSYVWNFGDGTGTASGPSMTQTYTYPNTGTFTVIVTGTSDSGSTYVDTIVVKVNPVDDRITVSKAANPPSGSSVRPASDTITYILAVTNTSAQAITDVSLIDTLPSGVDLIDNGGGTVSGSDLTFTGITLQPGAMISRTIVVTVMNSASGELVNRFVAKSAKGLSKVASVTHTVDSTNLVISKTVDRGEPDDRVLKVGDRFTYTIVVTNSGSTTQSDVVITDVVSSLLDVVTTATTVSPGSVSYLATNTVRAEVGTLNAGGTAKLVIVVEINQTAAPATSTLANTARVSSDTDKNRTTAPPVPADLQDENQTFAPSTTTIFLPIILKQPAVTPPTATPTATGAPKQPNLQSKIEVNPAQPGSGQPATITVIVTNAGDAPVTDAFWVDLYIDPNPVPSSPNGGRWNAVSSTGIAWRVKKADFNNSLAPGATVRLVSVAEGSAPAGQVGYDPEQTLWTGSFKAGTKKVYAYADSFDENNTQNRLVEESSESDNLSPVYELNATGNSLSTGTDTLPTMPPRRGF